jgi:hypothetical protein
MDKLSLKPYARRERLGQKADRYGRTLDREGAPDPAISGAEAASLASHANAFACINAAAPACTSRVTVLRSAVG